MPPCNIVSDISIQKGRLGKANGSLPWKLISSGTLHITLRVGKPLPVSSTWLHRYCPHEKMLYSRHGIGLLPDLVRTAIPRVLEITGHCWNFAQCHFLVKNCAKSFTRKMVENQSKWDKKPFAAGLPGKKKCHFLVKNCAKSFTRKKGEWHH